MSKQQFAYATYIASTPENVFDARTDSGMTQQYWAHHNASDWKPGSKWEHQRNGNPKKVDICGTVIEYSRPKRLAMTWASPADFGNEAKTSRVRFDVEPFEKNIVRLTVTHSELEPGSPMLEGISEGWPMVLSNLKTLLETGQSMPEIFRRFMNQ